MPRLTPGQMVGLPWRWMGPTHESDAHGNQWWEVRVKELPEFFVAAPTHEAAIVEAGPALAAFLGSYLSHGEAPPLPEVFGDRQDVPEEYEVRLRDLQVA